MKPASMRRTFARPLSLRRQTARSSRDSSSARVQVAGGDSQRSQPRQNEMVVCLGMPSVMSTLRGGRETKAVQGQRDGSLTSREREGEGTHELRRQLTQRLAPFGSIGVPQSVAQGRGQL